jgi:membrane fusion protein, type I secretion system
MQADSIWNLLVGFTGWVDRNLGNAWNNSARAMISAWNDVVKWVENGVRAPARDQMPANSIWNLLVGFTGWIGRNLGNVWNNAAQAIISASNGVAKWVDGIRVHARDQQPAPAAQAIDEWYHGVPLSTKWPSLAGLILLLVGIGGFALWAALAPLNGAVVAAGTFVATGQNKLVQHLEGGIVQDIRVREGDLVAAGQVVVRLDDTSSKSKLRQLELKQHRLLATGARLEAEMTGQDEMHVPQALRAREGDPDVSAIIERQRSELHARRASFVAEESVLAKEITGIQESMQGYDARVRSTEKQLAIFTEELNQKNTLFNERLARKTDVLALQRSQAGLSGDLGELVSKIANAKENIARTNQRIAHLKSITVQNAVDELQKAETDLDDVREQIRAQQNVVERIEIRAPDRGIIVKLNYHTVGGVVAPGATILELLPVREELIIEAHVRPNDVTYARVGQDALVRLTALNQRITPTVAGKVIYLSADALTEQASLGTAGNNNKPVSRQDYYVVRVRLEEEDVRARLPGFQPTPGMPADVYIKTGERTFFEYIMRPILNSFSHAFKET